MSGTINMGKVLNSSDVSNRIKMYLLGVTFLNIISLTDQEEGTNVGREDPDCDIPFLREQKPIKKA